jgi:hypothetical protein
LPKDKCKNIVNPEIDFSFACLSTPSTFGEILLSRMLAMLLASWQSQHSQHYAAVELLGLLLAAWYHAVVRQWRDVGNVAAIRNRARG